MGNKTHFKYFGRNTRRQEPFEEPGYRWNNDIKMDLNKHDTDVD
jgi:hypothetical protein